MIRLLGPKKIKYDASPWYDYLEIRSTRCFEAGKENLCVLAELAVWLIAMVKSSSSTRPYNGKKWCGIHQWASVLLRAEAGDDPLLYIFSLHDNFESSALYNTARYFELFNSANITPLLLVVESLRHFGFCRE